ERHDVGPVEPLVAMEPDQLAVDANRRGAGGEPQHRVPPRRAAIADDFRDSSRHSAGNGFVGFRDHDRNTFRNSRAFPSNPYHGNGVSSGAAARRVKARERIGNRKRSLAYRATSWIGGRADSVTRANH